MKISKIIAGALMAGGCVVNTACEPNKFEETTVVENQISKVMENKPYSEFKNATKGWREGCIGVADAQSSLDSVAYRQVFDASVAANDSAKVAEFNKIAASRRLPAGTEKYETKQAYLNMMQDAPTKDANKLKNVGSAFYTYNLPAEQHIVDSVAYNNFFRKNNLINEKTDSVLKNIQKMIKPIYTNQRGGSAIKYLK